MHRDTPSHRGVKSECWRTEGAGWQERSRSLVWTKPAKKVCSPGEKSSREMPGSRDLKVGVHGTQAAESRRKWGCHAANLWYQCSSAYKQRLLKGSLCELACLHPIRSGKHQKGFGKWHKYCSTCCDAGNQEVLIRKKQTIEKQRETLQGREDSRQVMLRN